MSLKRQFGRCWLPTVLVCMWLCAAAVAQDWRAGQQSGPVGQPPAVGPQPGPMGGQPAARPPQRVAERPGGPRGQAGPEAGTAQPNEHPLMPVLRWARNSLAKVERIRDYSATLVKRQRIDGKLADQEYLFLKVRHQPFSVYVCFLGPPALAGREVIYVHGRNEGNMLAHGSGLEEMLGTLKLQPTGMIAMRGQRYPLTEVGLLNLTRRLVEGGEEDSKFAECEVKFFKGAKINERSCTCIQIVHPVPRSNFRYHLARIFVDDELDMAIRYESYDWPKKPGQTTTSADPAIVRWDKRSAVPKGFTWLFGATALCLSHCTPLPADHHSRSAMRSGSRAWPAPEGARQLRQGFSAAAIPEHPLCEAVAHCF
jgi:hypothetical protein